MDEPHNKDSDADIGAFLHDIEDQTNASELDDTSAERSDVHSVLINSSSKHSPKAPSAFTPALPPVVETSADILILSEFVRRKTNKRKMSKRAIAITAYETQKSLTPAQPSRRNT